MDVGSGPPPRDQTAMASSGAAVAGPAMSAHTVFPGYSTMARFQTGYLSATSATDNRGCVNPEHLFLGDAKDNSHDCRDKERNARGETTYSKLTIEQVIEIRARAAGGESQRRIARDYPVGQSMVGFIVRKERWAHV